MRIRFGVLAVLAVSCSSEPARRSSTTTPSPTSTGTTPMPGATVPTFPVNPPPAGGEPVEDVDPGIPLPPAPMMTGVKAVFNRSSVRLYLPGIEGARDYRVYAVEDGVTVAADAENRQRVTGATLHCAGLRQRNQCDEGEILPIKYNNPHLDMPRCDVGNTGRRPNVPTQLMQTLEVNGIGPDTKLVVEAIDRQCPFPGLFGTRHEDVTIVGIDQPGKTVDAVIDGEAFALQRWTPTFPMRTEAEIRAEYGSMILNGQGPNQPVLDPTSPAFPESPYIRLAQPAPPDDPVVLARAVVKVSPTGTASLPPGFTPQDIWDDFEDAGDQPRLLRDTDYTETLMRLPVNLYQTSKWNLYDIGTEFSDFFVDRGQMNMVFGDAGQDVMSTQAMYPRKPVLLPTVEDRYLHVTYEVQRNETPRRYENISFCGSDQVGQTYDGDVLRAAPLPRPSFMQHQETARTSPLGWNCLLLVPRGSGYGKLAGGDVDSHADTSLKVTVVKSHAAPQSLPEYDSQRVTQHATAFGPDQDPPFPRQWMRQVDTGGKIAGVWLDDQIHVWQRTRFDVFVRRDRVVIYVEGEQRLCANLTASPLTMAEVAVGFWHILYHTSAEFEEIRAGEIVNNPLTGQHHILHNTPFADQRSWDNVGIRENAPIPTGFEVARCL